MFLGILADNPVTESHGNGSQPVEYRGETTIMRYILETFANTMKLVISIIFLRGDVMRGEIVRILSALTDQTVVLILTIYRGITHMLNPKRLYRWARRRNENGAQPVEPRGESTIMRHVLETFANTTKLFISVIFLRGDTMRAEIARILSALTDQIVYLILAIYRGITHLLNPKRLFRWAQRRKANILPTHAAGTGMMAQIIVNVPHHPSKLP